MAYTRTVEVSLPIVHAPCVYLRSKELYVTGQIDSEAPGANPHYCWCNLTQHKLGPDSAVVSRAECGPERTCYRETH
jgi:hypothetical protein